MCVISVLRVLEDHVGSPRVKIDGPIFGQFWEIRVKMNVLEWIHMKGILKYMSSTKMSDLAAKW